MSLGEKNNLETASELRTILAEHAAVMAFPGIGCWIVLLFWMVIVVSLVALSLTIGPAGGSWMEPICASIFAAILLYPISKFFEKRREQQANLIADGKIVDLCRKHGVERSELFRIAKDELKAANAFSLAIIDRGLAEKFLREQQGK